MKITRTTAVALIKGFEANYAFNRLPDDCLAELLDKVGYIPLGALIRPILAAGCKYAADCIWDKRYKSALAFLCTYGFKTAVDREYESVKANARRNKTRIDEQFASSNALYASYRLSEQWNICK